MTFCHFLHFAASFSVLKLVTAMATCHKLDVAKCSDAAMQCSLLTQMVCAAQKTQCAAGQLPTLPQHIMNAAKFRPWLDKTHVAVDFSVGILLCKHKQKENAF